MSTSFTPLFASIALPAAVMVIITSLALLISRNWRWSVSALAVQYIGVFILVAVNWPLELALIKMVAGWMAGAVLGVAIISSPQSWREEERYWPSGRLFRLMAAGLVALAVLSLAPKAASWVPGVNPSQLIGGAFLIGMGLLHLGLTSQPMRVVIGLMTVLSGFEILYAVVEASTLVAGLLAVVNLGLALAGAYLLISPTMEETE
jgi:hypothetical protein